MYLLEDLLEKWKNIRPQMLPYDSEEFVETLLPENRNKYTLAIKLLAFAGAFIGAIMFLFVLFLMEIYKNDHAILFTGVALLAASFVFSRLKNIDNIMIEPIVLVCGILGQWLFIWGILEVFHFKSETIIFYTTIAVLGAAILILSKNQILRYGAVGTICLSILGMMWETKFYNGVHILIALMSSGFVLLWLKETHILSNYRYVSGYFHPVSFGFLTSLILILSITINREFSDRYFTHWWISSVILVAWLLYIVYQTLQKLQLTKWMLFACGAAALVVLPTIFSPGIVASLLILILGFRVGQNHISIIGVLALIYFMMAFYYNLNTTLLLKSIYLMISGVLFLASFFFLKKVVKS